MKSSTTRVPPRSRTAPRQRGRQSQQCSYAGGKALIAVAGVYDRSSWAKVSAAHEAAILCTDLPGRLFPRLARFDSVSTTALSLLHSLTLYLQNVVQALPISSKPSPKIKPCLLDLLQPRKTRDCSRCTDSHSHPCARRGPPCASSVLHNTSLFHSSIRIIIEHIIFRHGSARSRPAEAKGHEIHETSTLDFRCIARPSDIVELAATALCPHR